MFVLAQVWTADWMIELWEHVPVLVLRTIITFITVLVVVRWTGKRSIANLAPFDLAMVIMIGEVAAIPISELRVDLLHGVLPVGLIGGLHVLVTGLAVRSKTFEQWTEGSPTLLVKDGRVLMKNLLKERVSMADLMTALRHKEVTKLEDVRRAWIEHAGGISVLRKHEVDSATRKDIDQALEQANVEETAQVRQLIEEVVQAHSARMRQELEELLQQYRVKSGG